MKQLLLVALVLSMVGSMAASAVPPTDSDSFAGEWINTILVHEYTNEAAVCTHLQIYAPGDTGLASTVVTFAGVFPVNWYVTSYFYSASSDNAIAAYAIWERDVSNETHAAFGLIEIQDNVLIMEIFFRNLASGVTDYRLRETFVRVPEENTSEDG